MEIEKSKFNLGELVSYDAGKRHYDPVTDRHTDLTCYARVLAIKFSNEGVFYQLSDFPTDNSRQSGFENWIKENKVKNRFLVSPA